MDWTSLLASSDKNVNSLDNKVAVSDLIFFAAADEEKAIPLPAGRALCSFCKKEFSNSQNANAHIKNYHLKSSNIAYQCNICESQFKNTHLFRLHINRTHKIFGVKNFVEQYSTEVYVDNILLM